MISFPQAQIGKKKDRNEFRCTVISFYFYLLNKPPYSFIHLFMLISLRASCFSIEEKFLSLCRKGHKEREKQESKCSRIYFVFFRYIPLCFSYEKPKKYLFPSDFFNFSLRDKYFSMCRNRATNRHKPTDELCMQRTAVKSCRK